MSRYEVISDPWTGGLRHGVFEIAEKADGGSREVARFYDDDEAQRYVRWRNSGAVVMQPPSRAQEAREKVAVLRMPHDEVFQSRRREGEDLTPPTTTAPVPIVNDQCECGRSIDETDPSDPWQPDPDSESFTRIHKACLVNRYKDGIWPG